MGKEECENKVPILKPVYLNFDGKKGGAAKRIIS